MQIAAPHLIFGSTMLHEQKAKQAASSEQVAPEKLRQKQHCTR